MPCAEASVRAALKLVLDSPMIEIDLLRTRQCTTNLGIFAAREDFFGWDSQRMHGETVKPAKPSVGLGCSPHGAGQRPVWVAGVSPRCDVHRNGDAIG